MAEAQAVAELVAEKRKLKKSLFRFDMIFFTVCAIVALDTIGQSSSYGAQAILWLIVSAVTFLIPYGLITAELGAAFPTEGATYDWVRLAYGHFAGALVGVLYWLSNPIWLGGTLTATTIAALDALWGSSLNGNQLWESVIGFFFIWGAVTMNILSLRYMKWVPNLGAIIRLALLAFFALRERRGRVRGSHLVRGRLDRHHQRVVMAVVAGFDLQDPLPSREPARDANRVKSRLGAGVGEAPLRLLESARQLARHHHTVLHGLREMRAAIYLLGDRVGDLRVGVADQHDAEAVVEVDVLVAVDVPNATALAVIRKHRLRRRVLER